MALTPTSEPTYLKKIFKSSTIDLPYRIMTPTDYNGKDLLPVVLFLHGSGERGNDNQFQLVHGSKTFQDSIEKYPGIYVFPQCPKNGYWAASDYERIAGENSFLFYENASPTPSMTAVIELLESIIKNYPVDKSRVSVMGLSMGGMGTFEILKRRPDIFCSAIAICGGGHENFVNYYNPDLRLWIAHGAADDIVPLKYSTQMHDAMKTKGRTVRFTAYEGVKHDGWNNVFQEPDYLSWLFEQ